MAPDHPVLVEAHATAAAWGEPLPAPCCAREYLTTTRQIVVASRDPAQTDPRFVFARHHWRTDNHLAALGLIEADWAGAGSRALPVVQRASRPDGW